MLPDGVRQEYIGEMPPPRTPDKPASGAPRKPRLPRPMTLRRLENIAAFHVERFATTAANLRRVLLRRAERARRTTGGDAAQMAEWVDTVVAGLVRSGAVDDGRYAASRAVSLRRLGKGPGKIRALLANKGVARPLIEAVLADTALTADGGDAALAAAFAYAQRRRLGPYGKPAGDAEAQRKQRVKDLAALGRAGFSYDVAKRVMSAVLGDDT